MKAALIAAAGLLVAARPADACGVPDFGQMLVDVAKAFDPQTEKIETPLVAIGGGTTTDGQAGSISVGYGWGERDRGGLFPGSALTRVMVGARRDADTTALSLTYGWYETQIGSLGFDFGVEHQLDQGTGPIARLTIGTGGIAARLGGGYMFGTNRDSYASGQVELVIDLLDLANHI